MTRTIHGLEISGIDVDLETRCGHYHGPTDIVALKFKCCGKWFPCHLCHEELAQHNAVVWPANEFDSLAVVCGACGKQLSVREYLECDSICPSCGRSFNPNCAKHAHYYFAVCSACDRTIFSKRGLPRSASQKGSSFSAP